jgi:hypothetical protein
MLWRFDVGLQLVRLYVAALRGIGLPRAVRGLSDSEVVEASTGG